MKGVVSCPISLKDILLMQFSLNAGNTQVFFFGGGECSWRALYPHLFKYRHSTLPQLAGFYPVLISCEEKRTQHGICLMQ